MRQISAAIVMFALGGQLGLVICAAPCPGQPAGGGSPNSQLLPDGPSQGDYPHLHNLLRVSDAIYSGGEPRDERAFAELARLAVKTVVSVDGARPRVELAEKYGLRYVHIPLGYGGIDDDAARAFVRVADEVKGAVYVHCHHGKHRGPAAAAAICVARGDAAGVEALKVLERAGTSRGYAGLWRDVEGYRRPAAGVPLPPLVATAEVGSLAAAMAQIDRAADDLKLCEQAGWRTPRDHPDLSPPQPALLLREGFRELARQLPNSDDYDAQFLRWMSDTEAAAARLEAGLKKDADARQLQAAFAQLQQQCSRCHAAYRNR